MSKFIRMLILIPVCSLPVYVAYAADTVDKPAGAVAISALIPVALLAPATRVAAPDHESHPLTTGVSASEKASIPLDTTLDVRSIDLASIQPQDPPQAITVADSDEVQTVTVGVGPSLPQTSSATQVSHAGIGSLYWALQHPTQAWRVLLPIQPHDGSGASEELRERCAIFAGPPDDRVACP